MLLRWDDPFGASMLATLLILCLLFQLYCKVSLAWQLYVKLVLSVLCLFHTMQSIYRSIDYLCNLSIDYHPGQRGYYLVAIGDIEYLSLQVI